MNTTMPKFSVAESIRLDRFLVSQMPGQSRTRIVEMISAGEVLVNGVATTKPGQSLKPGQVVEAPEIDETPPHDLAPAKMDLDIVFEDDALIAVNKPRGLATHPAASLKEPSLVNGLLALGMALSTEGEAFRPGIVHRLDKETTGLIVVAKTDAAHRILAKSIADKDTQRRYLAVAAGKVSEGRFRVDAPIGRDPSYRVRMKADPKGKPAQTEFRLVKDLGYASLLAAKLHTGRTHQVRVHLAAIGHPVLGDELYAKGEQREGPMQLHAAFLAFAHPVTSEWLAFFSSPPPDFLHFDAVKREDVDPWI